MQPEHWSARLLIPAGYLLVLGCFLLPFLNFGASSGEQHHSTAYSGLDLVRGEQRELTLWDPEPVDDQASGLAERRQESTSVVAPTAARRFAVAAMVLAVAGIALVTLRPPRLRALAGAVIAVLTAVCLIVAVLIAYTTMYTELAHVSGAKLKDAAVDNGFVFALVLLAVLTIGATSTSTTRPGRVPAPSTRTNH